MIEIIGFDADDTLWHMESLFNVTYEKFSTLLSGYYSPEEIDKKLFETEMRNLHYYGYGIKGFTLSMIETAIELTEGRIGGKEIQKIIGFGREMMKAPVQLLEHAAETIKILAKSFPLMLITKGDLFDQESKIARSGLSHYFKFIEIHSQKTLETYKEILDKYKIKAGCFLMVGNSLKSDILPVLAMGGKAVFIPYALTWEHEKVPAASSNEKKYRELEHIGLLPKLVEQLNVKS